MKHILFLLSLIFLSFIAKSQIYSNPNPTLYGIQYQRIKPNSVLHIPVANNYLLNTNDTSAQIRINNGTLQYHYGVWHDVASGDTGTFISIDSTQISYFADSIKVTSPPPAAAEGDVFIIKETGASGLYATHENEVATLVGGVYEYIIPTAGQQALVNDATGTSFWKFNGSLWDSIGHAASIGGNNLGADFAVGNNGNYGFSLKTNNINQITIDETGNTYFLHLKDMFDNNVLHIDSATGRADLIATQELTAASPIEIIDGVITCSGCGGGGGSAVGNYGNIQINRNGAFDTPASDSLTYDDAGFRINNYLSAQDIVSHNSDETKSIYLDPTNPSINMNGVGTTLHLNINNITGVQDLEFPNASGNLGESVTVNGTTTHFNSSGNADLGTIGGESTTASNGLTLVGNDVQLGGSLTATTTITNSGHNFVVDASGTGTIGIDAYSGSNYGIRGNSSTYVGVYGKSGTNAGIVALNSSTATTPLQSSNNSSTVSNELNMFSMNRFGSAGADGEASIIDFVMNDASSTGFHPNQLVSKMTTATAGARQTDFIIRGANGSLDQIDLLTISGTGNLKLNKYTSTAFTGTADYNLGVDASGNVVKTTSVAGTDTTVYQTIIDSTGQPGQPILWARDNKIRSSSKLQYDSINNKVVINSSNISFGGTAYKLAVNGQAYVKGALKIGTYTLPNTDGSANQVLQTNGSGTVTWQAPFALTTNDSVGDATFTAGVLNVPNYSRNGIVQYGAQYNIPYYATAGTTLSPSGLLLQTFTDPANSLQGAYGMNPGSLRFYFGNPYIGHTAILDFDRGVGSITMVSPTISGSTSGITFDAGGTEMRLYKDLNRADLMWTASSNATEDDFIWIADDTARGSIAEYGSAHEVMRLKGLTKRLGIATSAPTNTLHVNGDVRISTIANGTGGTDSVLVVNGGVVKKISATYYGAGGGSTTLAGLTDVTLTSLATNDFLKYNGSAWINRIPANVRTDLGLVIGTDVQAYDADLSTYAGITPSANVQTMLGSANNAAIVSNIGAQPALSGTGFVKISGTTISYDNSTYLTSYTETDPLALKIASNLSDLANTGTARTNLGATTVGGNFFTLTNPSAITFPRINADNTVDALSASAFRTAIGAGSGDGTVTSVTGTTNRIISTGGATPVIDISASYVGQTSITTLGTITTGTWNGTAIGDTYISSASTWNGKAASGANTDITSVLLNQTGLVVKGATSNALTIKPNETLSAARTLNIVTGDASRTLTFTGDASISGTNTGDQTTISGNAATATTLATSRNIWGQAFNGSADVTGSLTSVGDITGGASSMTITSGTGASRTMVLKTTTSGSTATTALTLAADQSATFANTVNATTFIGALTGTASKATNLVGGNGTTLLGSMPYQSGTDATTMLSPNTTTTKKFLTETGDGTNGAAPTWGTLAALTATNTTLTFSGSYDATTARTVGLNLGNANTWTATQTLGGSIPFKVTGSSTPANEGEFSWNSSNKSLQYYDGTRLLQLGSAIGDNTYTGTITWTGTAPSGTTNHTYNWSQYGRTVTLTITLSYGTAGATNDQVTLALPAGVPSPYVPAAFSGVANALIQTGIGSIAVNATSNGGTNKASLINDASGVANAISITNSGTLAAKFARVTITYITQ